MVGCKATCTRSREFGNEVGLRDVRAARAGVQGLKALSLPCFVILL